MKPEPETLQEEVERLRKFQDAVWVIIDHYIAHYVSPKEYGVIRELRMELWEKKLALWEERKNK